MTETAGSPFLELGSLSSDAFLGRLVPVPGTQCLRLAEPVKFKDCGEPRGQSEVPRPLREPAESDAKTAGLGFGRSSRAARLSLGPFVKWAEVSWE